MSLSRKLISAAARSGGLLSRYRGAPFADYIQRATDEFHRGLNNVNFNMAANGELRALRVISQSGAKCLFDVGANVGEWTLVAAELCPNSSIHAFEVVPATFAKLSAETAHLNQMISNPFGLSDTEGEITIHLNNDDSSIATACKIEGLTFHNEVYVEQVQGQVRRGADYLNEMGIDSVDFMKIDVEGMDLRVIKGFGDEIRRIKAIQFEYGIFNISSHDLLADFCNWLGARGFVIGKIFPRNIQFFDYDFSMENFHGSNYVAVREDEPKLIRDLTGT